MLPENDFPGSFYRKVDLHVHTPVSYDFNGNATAKDIVEAAINAGLDAIAVTDHNHFELIDEVKAVAAQTELVVFPGVEISTRDGHLLAIFDPDADGDTVRTVLSECGIGGKDNPFGTQDTITQKPIEEVAEIIERHTGIAILSHFDGPKGLLEAVGVGKIRQFIHGHKSIMALELLDSSAKKDWLEGRIYPTARACVQGSDAHVLAEIGSRFTWIRVSNLNISGLRQAFKDPVVRIRFSDEYNPDTPRSYIESLKVSQGFFGSLDVRFNPGLNCFVGGQGVGKSALIEFLRFVLGNVSEFPDVQKDHEGKLKHLLRLGGAVSVAVRTMDGRRFYIERTYTPDAGNPVRVQKIGGDGSLQEYPVPSVARLFPTMAYSQSEAMSVARDEIKQLSLIDSHIDISGEEKNLRELRHQLRENTTSLQNLDKRLEDVEELEQQKKRLSDEIAEIEKHLAAKKAAREESAIRDHQAWLDEEQFLKTIADAREEIKRQVLDGLETVSLQAVDIPVPQTSLGHEKELEAVRDVVSNLQQVLEKLKSEADKLFAENREQAQAVAPDWIEQYRQHRDAHTKAMERVGSVELSTLAEKLKTLKVDQAKVDQALSRAKSRLEQKRTLLDKRTALLTQIETEQARITTKRRKQAQSMTGVLNQRVVISVGTSKNTLEYQNWLECIRSREINTQHIQALLSVDPRELAQILRTGDKDKLKNLVGLSTRVVDSVMLRFNQEPGLIYELEEVVLEDLPDIRMRLGGDEYRPLDQLSTGQKFTVIILLSLVDDDQPVIYDQPEDALDTSMIYSDIAQILRRAKDTRQFIFATHNPNMSISADLDLALVIQASSSAATLEGAGGLSDSHIRGRLVDYLEGGTEAMQQRLRKLELDAE